MSQPIFTTPVKNTRVISVHDNQKTTSLENVVSEASILLNVNGEEWFNFLCTPMDLEELSAGFLFSSQIIKNADEIRSLEMCANGSGIDVWLSHPAKKPRLWQRNSGCSGGISVPEVKMAPVTDVEYFLLSPLEVNEILYVFYKNQKVYQSSGGVHASALFSKTNLAYLTEDIGRHNTLDKIAGKMLLSPVDVPWPILVTSGRISVEMMQKASLIRSCFVISRTSPTTTSVDLADQLGITLIGYAEKDRFKVYTHPEQIA
jgi:FdhD protein